MRPLALLALAAASLSIGCSSPCQDLGERLCKCRAAGTTKNTCVQAVKSDIQDLHPSSSVEDVCSAKLDTCNVPSTEDVDFCDWIAGRCGKAACGLSEEDLAALQDTVDPDTGEAICPK